MATAGRIVAALVSGTQETTLALAQVNFDFSLIKLEAPASFHGVGQLLSGKRKASAENGLSHVTARKLGALFEQILPSTPYLIDRYGSRASQIARLSENEETSRPIYGMFADQAGVDATSIWAAATSGPAAIAVHLLACMLARMFPGPEATSIWAELIEERKKRLACEDQYKPDYLSTLLAAQISIPRDQLAAWDNSARSWLRVADEAKTIQQTQLLLIIKNIHVPVNHETGTLYQSVIAAWVRALELMENLCRGVAQCVTPYEGNGELLLALSSWHMYPDMDVLGSKIIHQKDSLIPPEAILSVGLECSPAQQDIGVYWSLPLSHFRFYGPPKTAAHSLCTDAERVSFDHFRFVVLGSFLSTWNGPGLPKLELIDYAKLVVGLYNYLTTEQGDNRSSTKDSANPIIIELLKSNWLKDLSETCNLLLDAKETEKVIYERLVGLGIRRGSKFLANQAPLFGLISFHDFFDMLIGTEAKILALRKLAVHYDLADLNPLIRYRNPDYDREGNRVRKSSRTIIDGTTAVLVEQAREQACLELAESPKERPNDQHLNSDHSDGESEFDKPTSPQPFEAFKDIASVDAFLPNFFEEYEEQKSSSHQNILYGDLRARLEKNITHTGTKPKEASHKEEMQEVQTPSWQGHSLFSLFGNEEDDADISSINSTAVEGRFKRLPARYYIYASVIPFERSSTKRSWEGNEVRHVPHCRWALAGEQERLSGTFANENILNMNDLELQNSYDDEIERATSVPLTIRLGDPKECALFTLNQQSVLATPPEDIFWAIESGMIDRTKLANFLFSGKSRLQSIKLTERQQLERTALTVVMDTYAQFPKATIALKVIDKPLRQQMWVRDLSQRKNEDCNSDADPSSDVDAGSDAEDHPKSRSDYAVESQHTNAQEQSAVQKLRDLLSLTPERSGYFALLATFETGTLNPDPLALDKVMAMSSGDSIFVASHLLVDPWDSRDLSPSSICRIRGNIGRPGVAMMVPPPELQMRPRDSTNWQIINHAPFDGELFDSFAGTSLHLSFTEYNRPVDIGVHGVRDADLCFVEAYVQVRFKGKWIGDIDIISGLESKYFQIFDPRINGSQNPSCSHTAQNVRAFRVIAVDNWDEFIDSPKDGILVRAKDNWLARLAAANLSVQRQFKTIILRANSPICWPCVRDNFTLGPSVGNTTFIC